MSQFVEGPTRTFPNNAAIAPHLRVTLSAGYLAAAGATTVELGTMERRSLATDEYGTVRLVTAQGTCKMVASDAITAANPVYAAAGGKIAPTGTVVVGKALEAAGADGDIIEVERMPNTDLSAAIATTTAVAFEVDSDSSTPKIALSGQAAGTGNFTTTLKPEATLSADNAIIVPEADGDTLVAVALAQTLLAKTLDGPSILNTLNVEVGTPVAATGTNVGTAAAIPATAIVTVVTLGDDTTGVVLPTAVPGDVKLILNSGSAGLKVYPNTSDKINNGSANANITILENTPALFVATAADNWLAFFTANS
jgi:hypothetical protein